MVKPELDSSADYYRTLGITVACSQVDIRKAFLDLARTQHPDKNPGHETEFKAKFQAITTAYDVLKDPASKRTYDQIRPIAKKTAARTTPAARPFASASAKAASEAAARASAFPRQAKTTPKAAPKSPPKKPQARSDPFGSWTPPVPPNKSTPKFTSTSSAYTKDKFQDDSRGSSPFARRAPTASHANQSSSPGGVGRGTTPKKPSASTTGSTPGATRQFRTQDSAKADWTKEGWWGQSNTAYSTFHGPSSKYSPYAQDSKSQPSNCTPRTSDRTPSAKSAFEHVHEKSSTSTPGTQGTTDTGNGSASADAKNGYEWQKSRSAYQGQQIPRTTSAEKRPKKTARRPFAEGLKAGNPFFKSRSGGGLGLDSDLIDEFSGDENTEDGMKQGTSFPARQERYRRYRDARNMLDSSEDEPIVIHSSSESDTDDGLTSRRPSRPQPAPQRSSKLRPNFRNGHNAKEGFAKFRSSVADTEDEAKHSNSAAGKTSPEPVVDTKEPFTFKFKPPPFSATFSASASRKSSANVPSVSFNTVPDLNFSSPSGSPDVLPSGINQENIFSTIHKTENPGIASKKHPRMTESGDPRFPKGDIGNSTSNSTAEPSTGKPSTSLEFTPEISSSRTPLREQIHKLNVSANESHEMKAASSASFKLPVFEFQASAASQRFSFNSPTANPANSPFSFTFPTLSKYPSGIVPDIPADLLQPLSVSLEKHDYLAAYLARCNQFQTYCTAWNNYEQPLMKTLSGSPTLVSNEAYLEALRKHTEVLAAQQQLACNHLAYMESKVRVPSEQKE